MLKVSYSSMGNVASVLSVHNRNISHPKNMNLVVMVDEGLIAHFTTNAWLPRLFIKQMFEMLLMMRRNFALMFLKHLLRSVSEIQGRIHSYEVWK